MNKAIIKPVVLAAFVAASVGVAHAEGDSGDNGMSPGYGDSWAHLQARNPDAVPVPSLQAQEDAAEARATWGQTRERMRSGVQRWRENASSTLHRMTGTARTGTAASDSSNAAGATGTASGTDGTTGAAGTAPGTYGATGTASGTDGATGTASGAYGARGSVGNAGTGGVGNSYGTAGSSSDAGALNNGSQRGDTSAPTTSGQSNGPLNPSAPGAFR